MYAAINATSSQGFTDFLDISPLTAVLNSPPSSTKSLTASSTSTYATQLPTTLRPMYSANEQYRHWSSTYASTAMIGKTAGEHGYLLPNLPTIPHPPPPIVILPTEAWMASTHAQYTSMITMNSPSPPLQNGQTEWLQCTTKSMTHSNVSTRNAAPSTSRKQDNSTSMTGF